jgi:alkanesulfonate monooxygenase SsuD/methylene tetrahydromethanopterin reductase-like flavin-dependent oxidoreductase (luciferase family)
VRFGLDIAQQRMPFAEVIDRTRFAEDLGFDGMWGFDHFQPMYGEGPGECFEGMTTLAALATATTRIRLGLMVTGITYRPISLLATQAITIDHASNGRLELAIGAAWFQAEHDALGFPFPPTGRRVDLLEDALEILPRLFRENDVTHEGKQVSVRNATIDPKPVQQPSIPIWVGAVGKQRSLPLVAKHADAWHGGGDFEFLVKRSGLLDRLCEEAGRPPSAVLRATSLSLEDPIDDVRRSIDAWREAGFGYLYCGWPSGGRPVIEAFADAVLRG